MNNKKTTNPWLWVPTLYFAEGIPYFIVNVISCTMFTKMGVPNGQMALFTSLIYLPWVIKPLWSPFVDLIRTKRWWITIMQVLMSIIFILMALTLPQTEIAQQGGETSISIFTFTLVLFWIAAFASATHDIAADGYYMLALDENKQSLFVGIRSTFYRLSSIFGQGVLVVIAGLLETRLGSISFAWKYTLIIAAVLFALLTLYHVYILPRPVQDHERKNLDCSAAGITRDFSRTISTFFKKPYIISALAFMLLFRLPEALLLKMMNPFMLHPISQGGLGMDTATFGLIYGTFGVAALTIGGILGGIAAARWGLKKCLWPMSLSLALPSCAFLILSIFHPESLWLIGGCVVLDQFGYGFGFTAYMLYLIYFSEGEFKTAHYSLCTAFMALSMMVPGLFAGYIQEALGYTGFFAVVALCCLVTVFVTFAVKVDPKFGKKK